MKLEPPFIILRNHGLLHDAHFLAGAPQPHSRRASLCGQDEAGKRAAAPPLGEHEWRDGIITSPTPQQLMGRQTDGSLVVWGISHYSLPAAAAACDALV